LLLHLAIFFFKVRVTSIEKASTRCYPKNLTHYYQQRKEKKFVVSMGNRVKCPSRHCWNFQMFVFNLSYHTMRRGMKESVEKIDHQGGKGERNWGKRGFRRRKRRRGWTLTEVEQEEEEERGSGLWKGTCLIMRTRK